MNRLTKTHSIISSNFRAIYSQNWRIPHYSEKLKNMHNFFSYRPIYKGDDDASSSFNKLRFTSRLHTLT